MFFYRKTELAADTPEMLLSTSDCPLCRNKLRSDWALPLRYSPVSMIGYLFVTGLFWWVLNLQMMVLDHILPWDPLDYFGAAAGMWIKQVFSIALSLLVSFHIVSDEVQESRVSDYKVLYGLRCPTCGNGFAGTVPMADFEFEVDTENPGAEMPAEKQDAQATCHD